VLLKEDVANGNDFKGRMSVNKLTPSFTDDTVTRNTNFEYLILQLAKSLLVQNKDTVAIP
jgi:hypothetical protein